MTADMLLVHKVLKSPTRVLITWLFSWDVFEIRGLFRSAPRVSESNKGLWLSSSCVCRRKRALVVMTIVEVADVATQLSHPHRMGFTGSSSILELTELNCSFARCCVALLHPTSSSSSSLTASVSTYSLTYSTWIVWQMRETFNHSHLESVWS